MKKYNSMDAIKYGHEVGFWEEYYRGKFKSNVEFFGNGNKDYKEELIKHYNRLLKSKDHSIENIDNGDYWIKHSAKALLTQLEAIENTLATL